MSLWWVRKDQLDEYQLKLIEDLALRENHLVLGPPGSGKTNVLLRRAQFVRSQQMSNVLVLAFTRSLTEFVKTGCFDAQGREIFPQSCVTTLESWIRWLYDQHGTDLPDDQANLEEWKKTLANGALSFSEQGRLPLFDALFVDEAQDLMPEEVTLLSRWSQVLFFVGDDRQKIYDYPSGLAAVQQIVSATNVHTLPFHYRLAPELCHMADRILTVHGNAKLGTTTHYEGPKPGHIDIVGPLARSALLTEAAKRLRAQSRAYGDLIRQGDRLGIIVARTADRDVVFNFLEQDQELKGKSQIIRARTGEDDDRDYDPSFSLETPICILTVKACKGIEFRAVHWLFCEELSSYHNVEHYYTVVTRAKTSLDLYHTRPLPQTLARAYSRPQDQLW